MRLGRMIRVLGIAALGSAAASTIWAQSAGIVQPPVVTGQIGSGGAVLLGTRTGAPYTATRKTTRVQTLANGTTITHVTTVKEARDSQGRTYRATQLETPGNEQGQPMIIYMVFDPVNRTTMNWSSNGKQVILRHIPEPHPISMPDGATQPPRTQVPVPRMNKSDFQIEDLGAKTIDGFEVTGQRFTRTIPAGQDGNDQPIVVTQETWTSSELHMVIQHITDDPRFGNTTMELTDIDRNEPDPSLFEAPEGYTVREIQPRQPNVVDTNPQ